MPSAVGVHVKIVAFALPDIDMESVSPETFSVQEVMLMATVVLLVPTGTVTAQVDPAVSAVAIIPETVKLTLHMTPDPVSEVLT